MINHFVNDSQGKPNGKPTPNLTSGKPTIRFENSPFIVNLPIKDGFP